MAFKFNIGDRVFACQPVDTNISRGLTGTVVYQHPSHSLTGWTGVYWDEEINCGHNCDGSCPEGHGWFVYDRYLEPIIGEHEDINLSDDDVNGFLLS